LFRALRNSEFAVRASFTLDTSYRVTQLQTGWSGSPGGNLDRSLSWTGDIVNSIIDNDNPGTTPPFTYGAQSQSFTYTPARRLATASGYYGALSFTYDGVGNRLSETANGVLSSYAYPTTSNRLSSVATSVSTRAFTYDAAGNILTDSRVGALGMTFQYDVEGRLSRAWQTGAPTNGGVYGYDAMNRLASRTATSGSTTATTLYVHDINNHIIAETTTTGQTLREYIWLNDLPVAVVDNVNTASPALYYVHSDHLSRPARMTAQNQSWAWDVIYDPFGNVSYSWSNPEVMNIRFPGQWFQLETGLAYNWHRHYDASLGRYVQPDPLLKDNGTKTIGGVPVDALSSKPSFIDNLKLGGNLGALTLLSGYSDRRWSEATAPERALFPDGPSAYGYVGGNPLAKADPEGLQPKDKRFGFPDLFWRWYHRECKLDGDRDLNYEEACALHEEWCRLGKP
jgi:RHS repeat-associated protein